MAMQGETLATGARRAGAAAGNGPSREAGPPWRVGFESLETEIAASRELEVKGELPAELRGTLYRNGPARHELGGQRLASWFDGDGMVHALAIAGGRITYKNRFVRTPGHDEETSRGKRLYGGFASRIPGGPLTRFARRNHRKNPANTNVVSHAGKLLALCEGGRPYHLDAETLETLGEDDMGGALEGDRATYSAHPHFDRDTGELWNFGVTYGRKTTVDLYCTTRTGQTALRARVPLPAAAMIHDFALTRTKAIVVVAPIVLPTIPLGLMLGQKSYADSLRYRPELGVRIAIVDRATAETRWLETDPFVLFHIVNAWDEGEDAVVDVAAYPDATIMQAIRDLMVGRTPTSAAARPERLRISRRGVTRTRLSETTLEFPRVWSRVEGKEHSRIYGVAWTEGTGLIGTPVAIDLATGQTSTPATWRKTEITGELVPVSKAGATSEKDVWLLALVLDAASRTTELRVLDGADLAAPPVATARLPHVVPLGFHGNWVAVPAPQA